jgi:hypothetical protein
LHRARVLSFPDRKKAAHETAVHSAVRETTGCGNDEAASPVVDIEPRVTDVGIKLHIDHFFCAARLASESRTAINAHP